MTGCGQRCHKIGGSQSILFRKWQDLKAANNFALNPGPERRWFGGTRGPKTKLEDRDRTDIKAVRSFAVQPGQDCGVRGALDDFANDVGIGQERRWSWQVDMAARGGKPAQRTDFLQRAEKGIVALDGTGTAFSWLRQPLMSAENGPQSIFNQSPQRSAFLTGLLLCQTQNFLIKIHDCFYGANLTLTPLAVNLDGSMG